MWGWKVSGKLQQIPSQIGSECQLAVRQSSPVAAELS